MRPAIASRARPFFDRSTMIERISPAVLPGYFLAAITALVLGGCASSPDSSADPTRDHMYAHFSAVGGIQTAVIFGDLAEAREGAARLATHEEPAGLPSAGEPYVQAMRTAAERLARSTEPGEAALATAVLGATCGGCHIRLGTGPVFRPEEVSPTQMNGTMVRHIQGADRLWEGLIGPSEASWAAGASLLAQGSVDPGVAGNQVGQESVLVEIFRLGREAQEARGMEERTEVYSRILATCSACHLMP